MIYLRLFFNFFKTGLFAVGGGMATLPFLVDIGNKTGWFSLSELSNMVAVSESTPGPIGINMATYVGYSVSGLFGSLAATLGLICPSIIVITVIASILNKFKENRVVEAVFVFLRATVTGLLAYALLNVLLPTVITDGAADYVRIISFIVFFVAIQKFKNIHPIIWIALGALLGIICF